MGKNDSFIYTQILETNNGEQRISKKKQITAREYIEMGDLKDPLKRQVRKMR